MNQKLTVGFAGLGNMGTPMAANVAKSGLPLVVWNRTADKAEHLAAQVDCEVATNLPDLARRCDVMVTMVADGSVLEELILQDAAVSDNLKGKVLMDASTTGPAFATQFARRVEDDGIHFVESPVSGSTAAARAGSLMLMVGASDADLERVRPILAAVGSSVHHLGLPGAASLAKLAINNLIYGINQCVAESLILAERGGLDRTRIYDAFLDSAAAAPVMRYRREQFLNPDQAEVSFALKLAEKDLRLTTELADALNSPTPQAVVNRRVIQAAIAEGFGEADLANVAEFLRGCPEQFVTASKEA